jgi:hypothetical protein
LERSEEEGEKEENVSGYFSTSANGTDMNASIRESRQEHAEEESKPFPVGKFLVVGSLKLLFVVFFVSILISRLFRPRNEEFLHFASTIDLHPQ